MRFGKAVLWFLVYLVAQGAIVGLVFQFLFWTVGAEKLFSIPLVYNAFRMCPLVFLGVSYQLARSKVYGDEHEQKPDEVKAEMVGNRQKEERGQRLEDQMNQRKPAREDEKVEVGQVGTSAMVQIVFWDIWELSG